MSHQFNFGSKLEKEVLTKRKAEGEELKFAVQSCRSVKIRTHRLQKASWYPPHYEQNLVELPRSGIMQLTFLLKVLITLLNAGNCRK